MKTVNVYESMKEAFKALNNCEIERGQDIYIMSEKPKVKKDIHLYRCVWDKYSKELVFTNY